MVLHTCSCNAHPSGSIEQVMKDEDSEGFERGIIFTPAYACEVANRHGKHGMDMIFYILGPEGATQWLLSTGWQINTEDTEEMYSQFAYPRVYDLGYHALKPQYEKQEPTGGECSILGTTCYYDGSGLRGEKYLAPFLREGPNAIWAMLLGEYRAIFSGGK